MSRTIEMTHLSPTAQVVGLIVWVGLCFLTAWIGSRFSPGSEWYQQLQKPSWTPPGYVFGPVWSLLYLSMGVAAWLVWKRFGFAGAPLALTFFIVQLVLNGMWSWMFFGLHRPGLAFAEIIVLWCAIIATMISFWQKRADAGLLFLPYAAWVSFATILNGAIWRLNSGQR